MGRFRLVEDAADNGDAPESEFEFVASPGQEGAIFDASPSPTTAYTQPGHLAEDENNRPSQSFVIFHSDAIGAERNRKGKPLWFYVALIATILQVAIYAVRVHGPPGPPASWDNTELLSWQEFMSQHGSQLWESCKALLLDVPVHVGGWWATSLISDVQQWWATPPPCSSLVPNELNDLLEERISAQPLVADTLSEAVQSWQQESPLVLLMVGGPGTGKRTATEALASVILTCPNKRTPVSIIDASLFGSEGDKGRLGSSLWKSCQANNIIALQHIEDMTPPLLDWLLNNLKGEGDDSTSWALDSHCKNSIVVLTSSTIGLKSLVVATRRHLPNEPPRPGVLLDVSYEINQHLPRMSEQVDAVIPFLLLDQSRLTEILFKQLQRLERKFKGRYWESMQASDAFIDHILDPHSNYVEYITWQADQVDGATPEHTFSTVGAEALNRNGPIWTKVYNQVEICLASSPHPKSRLELDFRDGQGLFEGCDDEQCLEICRFRI